MDTMTALATGRLGIIVPFTPQHELLDLPVPQAVADLAIVDCKGAAPSARRLCPLARLAIEF